MDSAGKSSNDSSIHVIAHRGASAYAPENTLPAFQRALELGATEVELDVQLSRDDVLVLYHDTLLETKTDRVGRVRDHTAAELAEAEIGSWFDREHPGGEQAFTGTRLTTLDEVFARFGSALRYHVEIKGPEETIPRLILESVRRHGLEQQVMVTSFQLDQLERLRAIDGEIPICLLAKRDLEESIDVATRAGFNQLAIRAADLTPELVALGRAAGIDIRAWGIHDEADMERALAAGVSGMTLNWPDRLLRRLQSESSAP